MLHLLSAGIANPLKRTFAWCGSVDHQERLDSIDGALKRCGYSVAYCAHFSGGRSWPDAAANGGGYPLLLFSQATIDLLQLHDASADISDPVHIEYEHNKSLSKTGPPIYRTFRPSTVIPREGLGCGSQLPAIFRIEGRGEMVGCAEELKDEIEGAGLRNFQFRPLIEYLDWSDKMHQERLARLRKPT